MINLNSSDLSRLRTIQKTHKDRSDYIKATTILMLHMGYGAEEISSCLGIGPATVYRYQDRFSSVPLDEFFENRYQSFSGKLSPAQEAQLVQELSDNLYVTCAEVRAFLLEAFGIEYSISSLNDLMHSLGFSYKKTSLVPSKADPVKQQEWVDDFTESISKAADNEVFMFIDGVHPVHNTKSEYAWIPKGKRYEMPANSGGYRVNINGAINILQPEKVHIVEAATINSQTNIKLFSNLLEAYPDKIIYVYSDNAGYNHSKELKAWLKTNPRIVHRFLPPYSPNLNPIERLWKYMKKTTINSFFYETGKEFKNAILDFFKNIETHKEKLYSLITLKFNICT